MSSTSRRTTIPTYLFITMNAVGLIEYQEESSVLKMSEPKTSRTDTEAATAELPKEPSLISASPMIRFSSPARSDNKAGEMPIVWKWLGV